MIDDIPIDLWSYWNFASIEDIKRKCNIMVDLSKFTPKKKYKKLGGVLALVYN